MGKDQKTPLRTTASINAKAFAAKERRRLERASYPPERKMEIVEKLRDATRELRTQSVLVKKGKIPKG
jgi:hypothetical protein